MWVCIQREIILPHCFVCLVNTTQSLCPARTGSKLIFNCSSDAPIIIIALHPQQHLIKSPRTAFIEVCPTGLPPNPVRQCLVELERSVGEWLESEIHAISCNFQCDWGLIESAPRGQQHRSHLKQCLRSPLIQNLAGGCLNF